MKTFKQFIGENKTKSFDHFMKHAKALHDAYDNDDTETADKHANTIEKHYGREASEQLYHAENNDHDRKGVYNRYAN